MMTPDRDSPGLLGLEGEGYAHCYLARLNQREATAHDLANLVQYLGGGPVLEGFCLVLHAALLRGAAVQ